MSLALTALEEGIVLNRRFRIISCIGDGGFSLIYRAEDLEDGSVLVLKECAPHGAVVRSEEGEVELIKEEHQNAFNLAIQASKREARVLKKLTDNHVLGIPFYRDEFEERNTHYIAMDEARGVSLHVMAERYRLNKKPFPGTLLSNISEAVLGVLVGIHEAGFFHCDIKPANIIISEDASCIYLLDFGAVRTAQEQHDENVQVTPGFSPPEFYPGHRANIGAWTDMYMLAALLYSIISGKAPMPANERAVRDRNISLKTRPELLKIYPQSMLNAIEKALQVDHKERFGNANSWLEFCNSRLQLRRKDVGSGKRKTALPTQGQKGTLKSKLSGSARIRQMGQSAFSDPLVIALSVVAVLSVLWCITQMV